MATKKELLKQLVRELYEAIRCGKFEDYLKSNYPARKEKKKEIR